MRVSVVIRTLNEARYLGELLRSIGEQETDHEVEVVLVDSGSTDETLQVAKCHGARIVHIGQDEFTFGRSLNYGCDAAKGEYLAFISGHCIPACKRWIQDLAAPLVDGIAVYSYGRQLGRDTTRFSERQVFDKYFPTESMIPQQGFFCNNANAMLRKDIWKQFRFNEELTGLEDMYLAKQATVAGHKIAYVASAPVYHIHDESWERIRIRYERESVALREIMPEVHISMFDLAYWVTTSIWSDYKAAIVQQDMSALGEIILYRINQYWGSFRGNHEHRKLSNERKHHYFYPTENAERRR